MTGPHRHWHPDFMVCVADPCHGHKHRRHPGRGHCESCVEDSNQGYGDGFTFLSSCTGDDRCCCRDNRIGRVLDAKLRER